MSNKQRIKLRVNLLFIEEGDSTQPAPSQPAATPAPKQQASILASTPLMDQNYILTPINASVSQTQSVHSSTPQNHHQHQLPEQATPVPADQVGKKFVYFANKDDLVRDVRHGIARIYAKLYPNEPALEFLYIRDITMFDLADEFIVKDVFDESQVVYAAVKKALPNLQQNFIQNAGKGYSYSSGEVSPQESIISNRKRATSPSPNFVSPSFGSRYGNHLYEFVGGSQGHNKRKKIRVLPFSNDEEEEEGSASLTTNDRCAEFNQNLKLENGTADVPTPLSIQEKTPVINSNVLPKSSSVSAGNEKESSDTKELGVITQQNRTMPLPPPPLPNFAPKKNSNLDKTNNKLEGFPESLSKLISIKKEEYDSSGNKGSDSKASEGPAKISTPNSGDAKEGKDDFNSENNKEKPKPSDEQVPKQASDTGKDFQGNYAEEDDIVVPETQPDEMDVESDADYTSSSSRDSDSDESDEESDQEHPIKREIVESEPEKTEEALVDIDGNDSDSSDMAFDVKEAQNVFDTIADLSQPSKDSRKTETKPKPEIITQPADDGDGSSSSEEEGGEKKKINIETKEPDNKPSGEEEETAEVPVPVEAEQGPKQQEDESSSEEESGTSEDEEEEEETTAEPIKTKEEVPAPVEAEQGSKSQEDESSSEEESCSSEDEEEEEEATDEPIKKREEESAVVKKELGEETSSEKEKEDAAEPIKIKEEEPVAVEEESSEESSSGEDEGEDEDEDEDETSSEEEEESVTVKKEPGKEISEKEKEDAAKPIKIKEEEPVAVEEESSEESSSGEDDETSSEEEQESNQKPSVSEKTATKTAEVADSDKMDVEQESSEESSSGEEEDSDDESGSSADSESEEEQEPKNDVNSTPTKGRTRNQSQLKTPENKSVLEVAAEESARASTSQPKSKFAYLNKLNGSFSQITPTSTPNNQSSISAAVKARRRSGKMEMTPLSAIASSKKFAKLRNEAAETAARRATASLNASPIGSGTSTPTPLVGNHVGGGTPADSDENESDSSSDDDSSSSDSSSSESDYAASQPQQAKKIAQGAKHGGTVIMTRSQSEGNSKTPSSSSAPLQRRNTTSQKPGSQPQKTIKMAGSNNKRQVPLGSLKTYSSKKPIASSFRASSQEGSNRKKRRSTLLNM